MAKKITSDKGEKEMKAVKLFLTIDVEELPCCQTQLREICVRGVLSDDNIVYAYREGYFYKRELAGLKYDEARGCYYTPFPVDYDEDIMTGHDFEEIKLSVNLNFHSVLKTMFD